MKGLCLLHDRFYASSPRDLPRYTSTEAERQTMHHMYSHILTLSTDVRARVPVCTVYAQKYLCSLKANREWARAQQVKWKLVCCSCASLLLLDSPRFTRLHSVAASCVRSKHQLSLWSEVNTWYNNDTVFIITMMRLGIVLLKRNRLYHHCWVASLLIWQLS